MWSIKGTTAWESVTPGSSDPALIPERFYIQSASIPCELSIHQVRLIWDAAALRLPGSHSTHPHSPSPLELLPRQLGVIAMFFISSSEPPVRSALCPGHRAQCQLEQFLSVQMFLKCFQTLLRWKWLHKACYYIIILLSQKKHEHCLGRLAWCS